MPTSKDDVTSVYFSVAKCVEALAVSSRTFDNYKIQKPPILSTVVPDSGAVSACPKFADDHRYLVEPACGATLSAIYSNVTQRLQEEGKLGTVSNALVIVCGGSSVTLELLQKWKKNLNL
ncbi:hypothetical protein SNE40_003811 [Patella caerulea]|uniref:L-serine ammonia-lyase n=1 Tax=Patella caerulea TaxID=87958 RepID=A0AAN8KAL2_PATCE